TRQLHGTHFVRREPTRADFYSLVFANSAGEEVRVVWSLSPAIIALHEGAAAVDFQGRPIAATSRLTVDDSPVFIHGELADLPAATACDTVVADSARDFASPQGHNGWYYGALLSTAAAPTLLQKFSETDWGASWTNEMPHLSLTAGDQHPSVADGAPVAAV